MDDNAKNTASYQLDQDILDARGIDMTVEEVAGLSTCKYSERVQSLNVNNEDMAFLKGLRRRIKNRLASQNSRRRSVEHLRRLARELRAVRACRDDALSERRTLLTQRDLVRERCRTLRRYIVQILQDRSDTAEVPSIDVEMTKLESQPTTPKKITVTETKTPLLPECFETDNSIDNEIIEAEKTDTKVFECRIDKLVQNSVNHIFKSEDKKICAKTVFISNEKLSSEIKSMVLSEGNDEGVLNLSLKEGRRKSHGRKQLAPRRIAYVYADGNGVYFYQSDKEENKDGALDLKIKKETP